MKISYVFQLKDFLSILIIGVIVGFVLNFFKIITIIKYKTYLQIIYEFFSTLISSCVLIVSINYINMGEMRLFLLVGYILGIVLQKITLGKLFAKLVKFMYNRYISVSAKFKTSKLGKIILK